LKDDGKCSNRNCLFGDKNAITPRQKEIIEQLCEELKIDTTNKHISGLTKDKASRIIQKLLAKKEMQELTGSDADV
jgi:hypothetical protein